MVGILKQLGNTVVRCGGYGLLAGLGVGVMLRVHGYTVNVQGEPLEDPWKTLAILIVCGLACATFPFSLAFISIRR